MSKRGLEVYKVVWEGEKRDYKLYVGNLDHRLTEYHVIKLFSPFGNIRCEEYMWHTHGPKRGEPRGYAFVEFSERKDAERAKASMNGRLAFGRPLVVRLTEEKVNSSPQETTNCINELSPARKRISSTPVHRAGCFSKSAKIAAIQNKLKLMETEESPASDASPRS